MIKNIVIDCDGVLTDGKKIVGISGHRELIAFHSRDNEAVRQLISDGYRVIIVTASRFPGIFAYWRKYNAEVFHLKDKVRLNTVAGLDWSETVGVGDDVMDQGFLHSCRFAYVPADAHPDMKKEFTVLKTKGGEGILSEIIHHLAGINAVNGTMSIT